LPTVAVFGPTDPTVWAPRGEHVFPLRHEAGCRCITREEQSLCLERSCMAIPPETVSAALQQALERASASLAT
jgi:ADP-heptose:LPS heptosyltransferase